MFDKYFNNTFPELPEKADNKREELLFTYEKLHSYILLNDTLILQILAFTLTAVSVAIGFGLKLSTSIFYKVEIFAGLTGLVAISATQTVRRVERTFMMAIYLRLNVECDLPNIQWESDLHCYRDKRRNRKKRNSKAAKTKKQSLKDFQQAAVLITYRFILASIVVLAGVYTFRLYFVMPNYFNVNLNNFYDRSLVVDELKLMTTNFDYFKLVIAELSFLASLIIGVVVFIKTINLRIKVNGGIENLWKEVKLEKQKLI